MWDYEADSQSSVAFRKFGGWCQALYFYTLSFVFSSFYCLE